MRKQLTIVMACSAMVLIAGCEGSGLSLREAPGSDYSQMALAFHPREDDAPAKPVAIPMRLAVAQLGEVAPPQVMIDALRNDKAFTDVFAVPGIISGTSADRYGSRPSPSDEPEVARDAARRAADDMCRVARDGGADYLLVFGGSMDHATTGTPLSVLDLTIIGAFIVPGQRISAEGRIGGTLVDARTRQAVFSLGAQRTGDTLAPSAARQNDELKLLTKMRNDLTIDLAQNLSKRLRSSAGALSRNAEQE